MTVPLFIIVIQTNGCMQMTMEQGLDSISERRKKRTMAQGLELIRKGRPPMT